MEPPLSRASFSLLLLAACAPDAGDSSGDPSSDVRFVQELGVAGNDKSIIGITIEVGMAEAMATGLRLCDLVGSTSVGCWDLDESSGATAYDDAPAANDGTYLNGVVETGRCASFDGSNDYVSVPDDPAFDVGTGDFTLSAWIHASSSALSGTKNLLDHRRYNPNLTGYGLFLYNGRPGLQLADGTGYTNLTSGTAVTASAWHHVAVTVERGSATGVQFYVDGVAWGAPLDPTGRPGSLATTGNLTMGRSALGASGAYRGYLCRAGIWDSALIASDIAAIEAYGL